MKRKRGGQPLEMTMARIEKHVEADPNGGCWLWAGHLTGTRDGYAQLGSNGKMLLVTRWILEQRLGSVLPRGIFACHTCNVSICVNPDHLYPGTPLQNAADAKRAGRYNRPKPNRAKISAQDAIAIYTSTASLEELAQEHGLVLTQIKRIRMGKCWRAITADFGPPPITPLATGQHRTPGRRGGPGKKRKTIKSRGTGNAAAYHA